MDLLCGQKARILGYLVANLAYYCSSSDSSNPKRSHTRGLFLPFLSTKRLRPPSAISKSHSRCFLNSKHNTSPLLFSCVECILYVSRAVWKGMYCACLRLFQKLCKETWQIKRFNSIMSLETVWNRDQNSINCTTLYSCAETGSGLFTNWQVIVGYLERMLERMCNKAY